MLLLNKVYVQRAIHDDKMRVLQFVLFFSNVYTSLFGMKITCSDIFRLTRDFHKQGMWKFLWTFSCIFVLIVDLKISVAELLPPSAPFNSTWFRSRKEMNVWVVVFVSLVWLLFFAQRICVFIDIADCTLCTCRYVSTEMNNTLVWTNVTKPDVIVTYLDTPKPLEKGDSVTLHVKWLSSGGNNCPASDWANHGYCKDDEPCMYVCGNIYIFIYYILYKNN